MRKLITFTLIYFSFSSALAANPITQNIDKAQLVGKGNFSFYFWDIYDAELYASNRIYDPQKPFALKLTYKRNIKSADIVNSTIDEIRKQGFDDPVKLSKWHKIISKIFPDIKPNETLTGIYLPEQHEAIFYNNGKICGKIKDKELIKRFFDIWLSEKTSAPHLRKQLLSEN